MAALKSRFWHQAKERFALIFLASFLGEDAWTNVTLALIDTLVVKTFHDGCHIMQLVPNTADVNLRMQSCNQFPGHAVVTVVIDLGHMT